MMDLCRLTNSAVDQPDGIKMVEIDFQALCRICGALGENLTSVFGKRAADRLRERISRYLQVEISQEDCLPTKICDDCRETVDRFHELFEKCHRMDEKFRSIMSSAEELTETQDQQSSPEGKPKQRHSKIVDDVDIKSLEKEENSSRETEVPGEMAKKNTKDHKRKEEEDNQEAAQETKGDDLRRAIQIVSFSEYQEEGQVQMEELFKEADGQDIYSDYQYIDAVPEEEEEVEDEGESSTSGLERVPTSRELVETAKVVDSDGTIYYECAACRKRIKSLHTYQAHLRIHNGERPYHCALCPKTFRVSQGLARHIREFHERLREYPCEICGDRFGNKRNLDEHRNRHTNERPYRCDICGSSYNQKAALLIHGRIHRAERNFVCGTCSKRFHTRTKLQLHESTHSDERPFGCDQCELRFRTMHDVRRHGKNHSTEKPFQCGLCEALFKQKRYLLKHLKTQHQHQDDSC